MTNREDYLDSLLMSVSNAKNKENAAEPQEDAEPSRKRKKAAKPASPEDEFLKSFEEDFLDLDEDDFLREYEESLGMDEEDFPLEELDEDFVDANEDMMVDTMSGKEPTEFIDPVLPQEEKHEEPKEQDPLADLAELLASQPGTAASSKADPLMAALFTDETVPKADAFDREVSGPDAFDMETPKSDGTDTEAPKSNGFDMEIPKADGFDMEIPKADGFDMEIPGTDGFDTELPKGSAAGEEKPKASDGTGAGPLFDDLDLNGVDFEVFGEEAPKEAAQTMEKDEDAELIDLLAGMSGDSDIAQITDMLKAHDNNQQMFGDEMADFDMSGEDGDELGFLDDLQAGTPGNDKGKKKKQKKEKTKKEKPKKQPKEKKAGKESSGGFKEKLSRILFGDDDDDELEAGGTIDGINAENISEENRTILKEMDKEQSKKGKKKEKKEKKEKEKKPKKEKEKKPKKEKAPKPPKEKKPKEEKPKVKWEPIPVKPLILTSLLGVSIVVLVILGSNLLGYSTAVQSAEDAYSKGQYMEAYREMEGMKIKPGDQKLYDRVRMVAYMQKQLDFYDVYWKAGMYEEALDALFQALNRYDMYYADATEAGVSGEYDTMYTRVEQELFANFSMMTDEARQIYACEDRKEYTARLEDILRGMGLLEEEE